jgi:hypothetical protein
MKMKVVPRSYVLYTPDAARDCHPLNTSTVELWGGDSRHMYYITAGLFQVRRLILHDELS